MRRLLAVLVLSASLSGCYRATVNTGLPAGTARVERDWAHGFLWGLVPPTPMDVGASCPRGVARVETQHSFLNQLAAGLTWGIYTPLTITATCAQ